MIGAKPLLAQLSALKSWQIDSKMLWCERKALKIGYLRCFRAQMLGGGFDHKKKLTSNMLGAVIRK